MAGSVRTYRKLSSRRWWAAEAGIRAFPVLRAAANSEPLVPLLNRVLAPYNPFDPQRVVDPYPGYEELRAGGPVFHHSRLNTWIVTGHAECEQVLRSESSVDRSMLTTRISPYRDLAPQSRQLFGSMMLVTDPPDHTRLRRLVTRAFTPRAVARLEPEVVKVANQLLDEVANRPGFDKTARFDAINEYAAKLPIYMIGEMLGLPSKTWPRLKAISDVVAFLVEPMHGFDPATMDQAIHEFRQILEVEFEDRRRQPRDDMLSVLVSAGEDGDRLSREEMISMCALLMVAGHETTTSLIGNALLALDQDRPARQLLLDQPSLAANAVEEFLRYDSPVQVTERFLTAPLELDGRTLSKRANVMVLLGAANRDPRVHDEPASLKLDRTDPRPLSFGHGIHLCIGAALARLEARIAIPAFVERFPDYRVDHSATVRKRSTTLRGLAAMPVTV